MNQTHEGRAARRTRPDSQLDADTVMVQFSPEVISSLRRLEAMVHDSKHFSPDILANLQEGYTDGKPMLLHHALTLVASVTREAMEHVNATGDQRAKQAVHNISCLLLGLDDQPPFTVTRTRVTGR